MVFQTAHARFLPKRMSLLIGNLYFCSQCKPDNCVTCTLNYSSLQSWGTKEMCSNNSWQPLKMGCVWRQRNLQGQCPALFGGGGFLQHKGSGLETSSQVTRCDKKVQAKWNTNGLKDEMHEVQDQRVQKVRKKKFQVLHAEASPSYSSKAPGLQKMLPRQGKYIKDIPGWAKHPGDTETPKM